MAQQLQAPRIVTIPPSVSFLETLARTLVEGELLPDFKPLDNPLLLPRVTLYLPTRRAARLLPEIFRKLFAGKAILLPKIKPIGDADEDEQILFGAFDTDPLPPAIPLLERQLAMTRLVLAWKGALRREVLQLQLDEPLGIPASASDAAWLAGDLLALLDEIETEEADWREISHLVPDDYAKYWQITLDFLKIIQEAWPEHLKQLGMMDPKARRSCLIRKEAERLSECTGSDPVIVAGVTGSVPATAQLLKAVSGLENGVLVLPGLDRFMDQVSWNLLTKSAAVPVKTKVKSATERKQNTGVPGHHQYELNKLLFNLDVRRDQVAVLADNPEQEMKDREHVVSEALRPAETSDGWMNFRQIFSQERLAKAFENVGLITAANETEEALTIAIALREAVERGEKAILVSPDRLLARRVASELKRWHIQVDDSAGRPLDQTPPAILAILVARLAVGGCDPLDLLSFLKHPLARLGLPVRNIRSAARALERGVLRGPRPRRGTEGLKEVVHACKQAAGAERHVPRWKKIHDEDWDVILDLIERLQNALEPLESLSGLDAEIPVMDLARAHAQALHLSGRDESGTDAELYRGETGEALAHLLTEVMQADMSGLRIKPKEWPEVLRALMAGVSVRNTLPGDPRVQILGPMEARLQSADLMILGGLNEGVWPQKTRNDPWLNRPMKQDMGLEPPERRIGASAHDFVQALGAKRVLLSRAIRADGVPSVASRWLQRLTTLLGEPVTEEMGARGRFYTGLAQRLDRASGAIRNAARPDPKPALCARPKSLSVTEIERLVRDPYAVYARHILGLQAVHPIGGEPGAADRGTIIHEALAEFLTEWDGPFDDTAVQALLDVGERHFNSLDAFPAVRALWWPRFERIAEGFIEFESKRAPRIVKRFLEIGGGVDLQLPGLEFRLRGRADRIDLLDDGTLSIIDYKTGMPPSMSQVMSLLAPQMPLEAAMVRKLAFKEISAQNDLSELLYLQLKGGEPPVKVENRNPKDKTVADLADEAWAKLESLVVHYAQEKNGYLSRARVMMEGKMDGEFDHLARVKEWATGEGEAE